MKSYSISYITIAGLVLTGCNAQYQMKTATPTADPVQVANPITQVTPSPTPSASPSPSGPYTFTGAGTFASPYNVATPADVQHLGQFSGSYFELTNDIDLTGVMITPISQFTGNIQGHNFALNNLTLIGSGDIAFITNLRGNVVNLAMNHVSIMSTDGHAAAIATTVYGELKDCSVGSGTITSPDGGNGSTTGVGNPIYTYYVTGADDSPNFAEVTFNGSSVNQDF